MSAGLPPGNWTVNIVSADSSLLDEACTAVVTPSCPAPPEVRSARVGTVTHLGVHFGPAGAGRFGAWHDSQGGYGPAEGVPEYTVTLAFVAPDETHGVPESFARWLDEHVGQHPSLAVYYILPGQVRPGPVSHIMTTMWERELATGSRPRARVYEVRGRPFRDVWRALMRLTPITSQTP
jgi:hypothetical protein